MGDQREQTIQAQTLVEITKWPDLMAWRNNTGRGWQGQRLARSPGAMVKVEPRMVILREARPIAFGLPGSPDIIGAFDGRAFGLEMKALDGRVSEEQSRFRAAWEKAGGLYGVPRSVEQALKILRGE